MLLFDVFDMRGKPKRVTANRDGRNLIVRIYKPDPLNEFGGELLESFVLNSEQRKQFLSLFVN